jgi:hypothetical protein
MSNLFEGYSNEKNLALYVFKLIGVHQTAQQKTFEFKIGNEADNGIFFR